MTAGHPVWRCEMA